MYMRYYPKQLKPIKRLQQISFDRGKRHYWSYDKGDYGFYKSEDQQYIRQSIKDNAYIRNYKNYSFQAKNSKLSSYRQDYDVKDKPPAERKSILKISNPQDIHLPSIQHKNSQTQTQLIIFKDEEKKQSCPPAEFRRAQHRRSITQPIEEYTYNFVVNRRFSPTFVCSISNPLPTYMISPKYYNSLNYVRLERKTTRRVV